MKRVLLIEDEKIIFDLLRKKLEEAGYEVMVAEDGEAGLQMVRDERPDMVVLDIVLPKRNGLEVLEEMHEEGLTKRSPVIIVSNSGQPVEIERAKQLGIVDWLVKTDFDPAEVVAKVNKHTK